MKDIKLVWKKAVPNKEGIWLRQCAAKGYNEMHTVQKLIFNDGEEVLKMDWGWADEKKLIELSDPKYIPRLSHFYWFGPISLPPDSNKVVIIREGKRE